jgi:hypothetical protein
LGLLSPARREADRYDRGHAHDEAWIAPGEKASFSAGCCRGGPEEAQEDVAQGSVDAGSLMPRSIRSAAEHKAALAEIERLWTAQRGTPEGDTLEELATLVDAYEREHFPIEPLLEEA